MIIGYARVSTTGQNLEGQTDLLTQNGCERIYSEKISGVKKERPQLDRMMDSLRSGDTVIITELTRLGRSVKELLSIIERIHEAGASIKSLRETWLDTTTHRAIYCSQSLPDSHSLRETSHGSAQGRDLKLRGQEDVREADQSLMKAKYLPL